MGGVIRKRQGQRVCPPPPQHHLSAAFHPLCQVGVKQEERRLGEGEVEPLLLVGSANVKLFSGKSCVLGVVAAMCVL